MNAKHHPAVAPSGAAVWLFAGGLSLGLLIAKADALGAEAPSLPDAGCVELPAAREPACEPAHGARETALRPELAHGPQLRVEQTLQDWGSVEVGQPVRCTWRLHNDGDAAVRLAKTRRLRSDLTVSFQPEIPPGGVVTVQVDLATGRLSPGRAQIACELASNAPLPARLLMSGEVLARR